MSQREEMYREIHLFEFVTAHSEVLTNLGELGVCILRATRYFKFDFAFIWCFELTRQTEFVLTMIASIKKMFNPPYKLGLCLACVVFLILALP